MNDKVVRRGYVPSDSKEFSDESMKKLREAQKDIFMLVNRGYDLKKASTFVGNHYLLSERQRMVLTRAISSQEAIDIRKKKEFKGTLEGKTVYIDGFNIIITLEVALSKSIVMKCMDGTVRDLAGLRGTYRLIDKTDMAINLIGDKLQQLKVDKVVFYLDSPLSNSGRMKMRILELLSSYSFEVEAEVVHNADVVLEKLDNIITSDAIILDKCESWINLGDRIISDDICDFVCLNFED